MPQASMAQMVDILTNAFKGTSYGFFVVPDRFDVLSKEEVREFLVQTVKAVEEDE